MLGHVDRDDAEVQVEDCARDTREARRDELMQQMEELKQQTLEEKNERMPQLIEELERMEQDDELRKKRYQKVQKELVEMENKRKQTGVWTVKLNDQFNQLLNDYNKLKEDIEASKRESDQ